MAETQPPTNMRIHRGRAVKVSLGVLAALLLWLTVVPPQSGETNRQALPTESLTNTHQSHEGEELLVSPGDVGGEEGDSAADRTLDEPAVYDNLQLRLAESKMPKGAIHKGSPRPRSPPPNILETVNLTAKDGFLWQPTNLGPLDCKDSYGDCDGTIRYCLMAIGEYQENPWKYPMTAMLQKHSDCRSSANQRVYKISALRDYVRSHPAEFLQPNGFIYHETRTGSTLVANMLAHVPTNIVLSEHPTAESSLRSCPHCSHEQLMEVVRLVLVLLGSGQAGHTHAFFKFSDATALEKMSEAFPEVPWIYLFRDPVEVMVSNLKGAYGKRNRFYEGFDFDAANTTVAAPDMAKDGRGKFFMSPCLNGGGIIGRAKKGKQPKEVVCASRLRALCDSAVAGLYSEQESNGGNGNGAVVEYVHLPDAVTDFIYPEHFRMGQELLEEHMPYLSKAASMYSKSMANPESEFELGTDAKYKKVMAEDAYRTAAESTGLMDVYKQLQGLQTWQKSDSEIPA